MQNPAHNPPQAQCFWIDTIRGKAPEFPALPGNLTVDVAIIGGGIVGMTTAEKLLQKGKTVAILEAHRVGQQVTGKSTAKVTSQHHLIYHKLIKDFGEEKARLYAEANQAAIQEIAALCERYKIDCDFERKEACVYARTEQEVQQLREETEAAQRLGLPAFFTEESSLPFAVKGAMHFTDQAQFNPCKYIASLARSLAERGCQIFEHTRVTDVDHGEPCRVTTQSGTVTTKDVVMATHLPLGMTGMFFARAFPHTQPILAARIDPAKAPEGMFISAGSPSHSIRTAIGNNGETYLVCVGPGFKTGHTDKEKESFADLFRFLREQFGIESVEYYWTNEDFASMDGAPFIGQAAPLEKHLFVATGFNAWGITNGTVAGNIISDLITGVQNPWAEVFDSKRVKPIAGGKKFLKENMHAGKHMLHGHLEKHPHSAANLKPGEAQVIDQDKHRIAAYRDESGKLHTVSANCPHLGCVVGWNATERSWDCPCHGSRFTHDGQLLHGPAMRDLKPVMLDEEEDRPVRKTASGR